MPRIEIIYPLLMMIGFGLPAYVEYRPTHRRIWLVGSFILVFFLNLWLWLTNGKPRPLVQWLPGDIPWQSQYLNHAHQFGVALCLGVAGTVLLSEFNPKIFSTYHSFYHLFKRLARRRAFSIALVGLTALAIGALFSTIHKPVPRVHDEFSYLLAADTFAHGRLTNPTHPEWVHFESFHIFHQPTYMSKYPPAQGLMLGLGQVLTGTPVAGIWLGTAFGCASICWMLYGWLPPRWAFLGGLLTLLSPTIQNNWGQSFQGGAIAMGGGALAFGAFARILKSGGVFNAMILGIGISTLAVTRPFEGVVTILPMGMVLAIWFISKCGGSYVDKLMTVVLPFTAVMVLAFAAIAFNNWSITGSPTRFPYQNDEDLYWTRNTFGYEVKTEPIVYNHEVLRQFYETVIVPDDLASSTFEGRLIRAWNHLSKRIIWVFSLFYLRLHLVIPLLFALVGIRKPRVAFAVLTLVLLLIAQAFVLYYWPHYSSPAAALIFYLVAEGLRRLWLKWGKLGRVLVVGVLLTSALELVAAGFHRQDPTAGFHLDRARIESALESGPGSHLILVRYAEGHDPASEWVYNKADIDEAKVVWARDRGEVNNQSLLEHYRGRTLWRLDADKPSPRLEFIP